MKTLILISAFTVFSAIADEGIFLGTYAASGSKRLSNGIANIILGKQQVQSQDIELIEKVEGIEADFQFNCQKLKLIYDGKSNFNWDMRATRKCMVQFICYPRAFEQKQILSLQRSCEKEAREECFSEQFLKYLKSLKLLKVEHVNQRECSKMLWGQVFEEKPIDQP